MKESIKTITFDQKLYPRHWVIDDEMLFYLGSYPDKNFYDPSSRTFQTDQKHYSVADFLIFISKHSKLKHVPLDKVILMTREDPYNGENYHEHKIASIREETNDEYYKRVISFIEYNKQNEHHQYEQYINLRKKFENK